MKQVVPVFQPTYKQNIDAMHQRSPLKKFEEEKCCNTVKLCLSILTCYNTITRVNKPSYHQLDLTSSNLDDSKCEVHDIKTVSSIT